ncbi:cytochrome c oxidase subunit II [Pseudoroseomonas rhizosphaerae]|uniref:Cytochrome c oxidase subunit 2 n=1 Tax=Teichococcus rhizosphaerae TaxID=1335062 RepID=A0A2C7A5J0_9PROT|nr:cytochrome c oxidase subunit II [Pseudoroseomonas rhizosphaerae]PHK93249.1 cytochrome c oxidase subunit II [Pseudoroseomonas rhizosphaerae]
MRRSIVLRFAGLSATLGVAAISLLQGAPALAQGSDGAASGAAGAPMVGAPVPWGLDLQQAGGPIKESIHDFNQLVLWIIVAITIFVGALLAYVIWRFRAEANPVPSRTSHHTMLEVAWTVVPVLILLVIAIPSFRLIYYQDRAQEADLTINVTGRQWYWHYAYPDQGNFAFDSYPVQEADLKPGQLRNLEVDEPLVVPVGKNIRILTTGQDVIHSFFVPSLGVQKYTIPGRTLETWMRADRTGTFYGQCNQICGTNHWLMPIVVKAVPQAEFDAWVEGARQRFAAEGGGQPAAMAKAADEGAVLAELRR